MLRYATLVLRSRTDAEDITQTVFLRALRAIERGERVRTPRNWLIKIAHNECRRLIATRKVQLELPDEIAVEPAEPGRAEELKVAMAALPATQRQALVLRELEGRTYAEISKALDVSESAVETLVFRARRALREQIENAMTCEEFAALLDDPSARPRVRAHARVCPECATLDHRSRGRKSALKRIASSFGLPGWGTWWGAKVAAIALTAATAAAVAVPHDGTRPSSTPTPNLIPHRPAAKPAPVSRGTGFTSVPPKRAHARPVVAAPKVPGTRWSPVPGTFEAPPAAVVVPAPPIPEPPKPGDPPAPPAPPPADPTPAATAPPVAAAVPAVTVQQPVLLPTPDMPAVTVPAVSVPIPAPALPTMSVPVETPKVSLP